VRPELDQPGLAGVQFQAELREPSAQFLQEPLSVVLVLEPDDEVVRLCRVPDYAELLVKVLARAVMLAVGPA
jgi:hypothetical protein